MKNLQQRKNSFPGSTYGEITEKGVSQLIEYFSEYFNNPDGVFYDLGSGKGKLSKQIAETANFSKVVGYELHEARHLEAVELLKQSKLSNLSFMNKNFIAEDFSDATIILCSNEAMPREVTAKVLEKAPKGCLIILGRKPNLKWMQENLEVKFKYTSNIHKTYTPNRGNWYLVKE